MVCRYLRIFDNESSLLSEVLPANRQLGEQLKPLPFTPFFTSARSNQVQGVYKCRLEGVGRRISLLNSLHSVAFCLDVRSATEDVSVFNSHILKHIGSFVMSSVLPPTQKFESTGTADGAVQQLFEDFNFFR
eukprot:gb/GEZJ01006894.1/.p1 GENE.gb/GEZJ01006894.1/~~gb/GEZJ01006894.1/.p1  ORF type:complete len:132 (-),score=13.70 gb/GEZJ01006894.1/:761-1156(-)